MNLMRILLTRKLHDFALTSLRNLFEVEIHAGKIPMPKTELIKKIKNVDGLICFPYDTIDDEVIESSKKLKVISTFSVGYDHIAIELAKKRKIRVGYTPEVLTDATADLAFSLLLDLMRRISEGDRIIRQGKWKQIYGANDYVGVDLEGKTVGILGMGRIGKEFANRARAFKMNIIYHNRNKLSKREEKSHKAKFVSFEKLLTQSDVISVHVPQTKETEQIFNLSTFKKMKKTSFLVNTSRGKIINEKDLVTSLKRKLIAGAALDVFSNEPIGEKNPLTKMENVVLAPHIGSSTKETRRKMAELTLKNLELGLMGKKPIYSVGF